MMNMWMSEIRTRTEAPLVEILAVLVEHLHAAVAAIVDEHATRLRIDRDAVHVVEVARDASLAALPRCPHVIRYLPSLSNFTTRVFW